jgi:hypothetical protein
VIIEKLKNNSNVQLTKETAIIEPKLVSIYIFSNKEEQVEEENDFLFDVNDLLNKDTLEEGIDIFCSDNTHYKKEKSVNLQS